MANIFNGAKVDVEMHVKLIKTSDVPRATENETSEFLMELFKEKDEVMDFHRRIGHFDNSEGCRYFKLKPNYSSLINFIIMSVITLSLLGWYVCKIILNMSFIQLSLLILAFIAIQLLFVKMMKSSKTSDASNYGTNKSD